MNKKERVFNTIEGKPVDHVPFTFWKHLPKEEWYGKEYINNIVNFYKETGEDMIKMMADGYRDYDFEISKPSDWRNVKFPSVSSPFIQEQRELIRGIVDEINDEAPVFYHTFTPFSALRHNTRGTDLVMSHLTDPEARPHFLYALEEMAKHYEEYIEAFLTDTGASGISITVTGAEKDTVPEELYKEYIAPIDNRLFAIANKCCEHNMIHMCSFTKENNRLELWKDYSASIVTIDPFVDDIKLEEAKVKFPNACAYLGGVDVRSGSLLETGSCDEIKDMTRKLAQHAKKGNWIVGTAGTTPGTVENEHIRWIGEALAEA